MAKQDRKKRKKRKFKYSTYLIGLALAIFLMNIIVGIAQKPVQLLKPISSYFNKMPHQTWQSYKHVFEYYGNQNLDPAFLAALAQVESAGNPIASPYWRLAWRGSLINFYQPASSSFGLYQFTNPTFKEARKFCIRNGDILTDLESEKLDRCWQNFLAFRFSANDSVHLASARLNYYVNDIIKRYPNRNSQKYKQELAAIIHLCGLQRGRDFARNNFNIDSIGRCGTHSVRAYINRLQRYRQQFLAMN